MHFFQARPFFSRVENPEVMANPKESMGTVSVLHRSSCKRTREVGGDSKHFIIQDFSHGGPRGLGNKTTACLCEISILTNSITNPVVLQSL